MLDTITNELFDTIAIDNYWESSLEKTINEICWKRLEETPFLYTPLEESEELSRREDNYEMTFETLFRKLIKITKIILWLGSIEDHHWKIPTRSVETT